MRMNRRHILINALKLFDLVLVVVSLLLAAFVFRIGMISIGSLLMFWAAVSTVAVATRLFLRSLLERLRLRGRNLRNILIVGTNCRALEFAQKIDARAELGYRIVGFVDQGW